MGKVLAIFRPASPSLDLPCDYRYLRTYAIDHPPSTSLVGMVNCYLSNTLSMEITAWRGGRKREMTRIKKRGEEEKRRYAMIETNEYQGSVRGCVPNATTETNEYQGGVRECVSDATAETNECKVVCESVSLIRWTRVNQGKAMCNVSFLYDDRKQNDDQAVRPSISNALLDFFHTPRDLQSMPFK